VREPEAVTFLRIRAVAQADDGMSMRDSVTFHAVDPKDLPDTRQAEAAVKGLADTVTALAKAPKGEDYSGPVLFEGMAGAQIFAEVLGKNLGLTRRPVGEGGRGGAHQPSELEGRIGARVLPDSFDVVDDPTRTEFRGRKLLGSFEADREGVAPAPVRVVEKGVLKGYLLTRQPVRGFEGSNGRAKLPGNYGAATATISNLIVTASSPVPVAELKKKLIELIQARSKPYGIIVRKMDFPSTGSLDEVRRLLQAAQGGRTVSMPLLVYKVFPDGREELIRALRFRGLNARSLKDVLAAGDDAAAFEYMENGVALAWTGGGGFSTGAAVIAPSILVDDLELHPLEDELPKLPVVPAPTLSVR
jgi:TldD protein